MSRDAAVSEVAQPATFEQVYDAHRLAIIRLAYLLVRSQAVAEELAQEAFTVLFRQFEKVDNPPAYVRTATVRLALRWQDRHRMEREHLESVGPEPRPQAPEIDETWEAIARLRPARRVVLVLRYYQDLSHDDIATIVGCSPATVRSRVRRALDDLRKELDP